jgi:hypothetical protein
MKMGTGVREALVGLALLCNAWTPLSGQANHPGAETTIDVTAGDTTRNRAARRAQLLFEDLRLRQLPVSEAAALGQRCDYLIGGACIWRETARIAPPESRAVRSSREALVRILRETLTEHPADGWSSGQLVRYLVELERWDEAGVAAQECLAAEWWCAALWGYVAHHTARFQEAEVHFEAALAQMPEAERRRWLDLEPLLDTEDVATWRELNPDERDALQRRFWWLADPLWSVPGNERRTEHLARHTYVLMLRHAHTPARVEYGGELERVVLRMGTPAGFVVAPERGVGGRRRVATYFEPWAREFLPTFRMVHELASVKPSDWPPPGVPVRTEYRPGYARRFADIDHQTARFRRGSSTLLLLSWELPPSPGAGPVNTFVWARADAGDGAVPLRLLEPPGRHALLHPLAAAARLIAVEAYAAEDAWAARLRRGVAALDGSAFALSDLLLLDSCDVGATPNLDDALHCARASTSLRPGERVELFWEVYGLAVEEPVAVTLSLQGDGSAAVGLFARLLRPGSRESNFGMQWDEVMGGGDVVAGTLALKLSDLPAGEYTLTLTMTRAGGEQATGSRTIFIVR